MTPNSQAKNNGLRYWISFILFIIGVTLFVRTSATLLAVFQNISKQSILPAELQFDYLPKGSYTVYGEVTLPSEDENEDEDLTQPYLKLISYRFYSEELETEIPLEPVHSGQSTWNKLSEKVDGQFLPLFSVRIPEAGAYMLEARALTEETPLTTILTISFGPTLRTFISQVIKSLGILIICFSLLFIALIIVLVTFANSKPSTSLHDQSNIVTLQIHHNPKNRKWAALCHLSSFLILIGVPFGNLIGPLLVWITKRNDDPFIDQQGKEALNFQISLIIYIIISAILAIFIIGLFLLFLIPIYAFCVTIWATVKVSSGESFTYPLTIRLIR